MSIKFSFLLFSLFSGSVALCKNLPGDVDVVIVGGGISALSAAEEAKRLGLSFVVLEASDRVGGLIRSAPSSDGVYQVESGPQFVLSSPGRYFDSSSEDIPTTSSLQLPEMQEAHYRRFFDLLRKAGLDLAEELIPFSGERLTHVLGMDGKTRSNIFSDGEGSNNIFHGVIDDVDEKLRIAGNFQRAVTEGRDLPPGLSAPWRDLGFHVDRAEALTYGTAPQPENAHDWGERNFGSKASRLVLESLVRALFFYPDLQEVSSALVKWMAANLARGNQWYVAKNGLASIVAKISAMFSDEIFLNTEVKEIEKSGENFAVSYQENQKGKSKTIRAKQVVVATPAPAAKKFLEKATFLTEAQRRYLELRTYSTIVVNVEVDKSLLGKIRDVRLRNEVTRKIPSLRGLPADSELTAGLFLVPRTSDNPEPPEKSPIASFSIETGKYMKTRGSDRVVLGIHMDTRSAEYFMSKSDTEIKEAVQTHLEIVLGRTIGDSQPSSKVYRIPNAISDMSHEAFEVQRALAAEAKPNGLHMAGQGAAFPTLEGAAMAGYLAMVDAAKAIAESSGRSLPAKRAAYNDIYDAVEKLRKSVRGGSYASGGSSCSRASAKND